MKNTKADQQIKDLCDINNILFEYTLDYNYQDKSNISVIKSELFDFKDMISLLKPNERILICLNGEDSIYWSSGMRSRNIRINSDMGSFRTPNLVEQLHIIHFLNNI